MNALLPCSRRDGVLPCERNRLLGICLWCERPLAPGEAEPEPPARLSQQVAAARRINRGMRAEADRAAGAKGLVTRSAFSRLEAVRASFAVRHHVSLSVVSDLLDDAAELIELLAKVRDIIDTSVERQTALAAIDGWADVRDTLYPDTDVARSCREQRLRRDRRAAGLCPEPTAAGPCAPDDRGLCVTCRRDMNPEPDMPPPEDNDDGRCDDCGAALALYHGPGSAHGKVCPHCDGVPEGASAWAAADIPDGPPACPTCGKAMHEATLRSSDSGKSSTGHICLDCHPLGKLYRDRAL